MLNHWVWLEQVGRCAYLDLSWSVRVVELDDLRDPRRWSAVRAWLDKALR